MQSSTLAERCDESSVRVARVATDLAPLLDQTSLLEDELRFSLGWLNLQCACHRLGPAVRRNTGDLLRYGVTAIG